MIKSESIIKIMPDLLKAQASMSKPVKGSDNPFFKSKYADLSEILAVAQPALNANNICILQPVFTRDGKDLVQTLLIHVSGEFIGSEVEIKTTKQNDSQAFGSAVSYARRYALQSLLSLSAVDDDGNKASEQKEDLSKLKISVAEKFGTAESIADLNRRYNWYKDKYPKIESYSWFGEFYQEKTDLLIAEGK